MEYNKKMVEDIDLKRKKVLLRCDFNVPQDEAGAITDDKRIVEALPTIKYLLSQNAKVIICSHLGRPKGKFDPKYSLNPIAKHLAALLGKPVKMSKDVVGDDSMSLAAGLGDGEIMMIENVRFHAEEEKNDPGFSGKLAALAEAYVNDAFGTAHRAHASTVGVAAYLPAVCGYLIQKELDVMGKALDDPKRPFVAILGGAKISDKLGVINHLLDKVDSLIIGGGMAYTFVKARGGSIGTSLCEEDKLDFVREMMEKAERSGVNLVLPSDVKATEEFSADSEYITCDVYKIPDNMMGLDIGPKTAETFAGVIRGAGTIVWNGPVGVFEFDRFAEGTKAVAEAVAASGAVSIIGGGDSAAAVYKFGLADKITHISTGGGASLEFLEGLELPGIACLLDKQKR